MNTKYTGIIQFVSAIMICGAVLFAVIIDFDRKLLALRSERDAKIAIAVKGYQNEIAKVTARIDNNTKRIDKINLHE